MKFFTTGTGLLLMAAMQVQAEPLVINDMELVTSMCEAVGAFGENGEATTGEDLARQLTKAPASVALELPTGLTPAKTYEERVKSVFMLGGVYNCGKCDKWHPMGSATAWCLTADGVMVTNYHVFDNAKGESWGVFGIDGKGYRVTEILAANKSADVAVFKVDGKDLTPLALADDAPVGARVNILSHPDGRFFVNTGGEVARYARAGGRNRGGAFWMAVTAEYAKGSSGGPVLDVEGRVVGMVSNTQSITYGPPSKDPLKPQGPHQMVIRNCVPVAAIHALVKQPEQNPEAAPAMAAEGP